VNILQKNKAIDYRQRKCGKEQVMKMLQQLLNFEGDPKHFDASDALAVAVCHHFQQNSLLPTAGNKVNGWKDFIAQNPGG
jgi:crossover junction endodeoxyribonuclease RuvC